MTRKKCMGSELSVFKGREARLNLSIFTILALLGPLTINELQKHVSKEKGLGGIYYASMTKRMRWLVNYGYVEEIQPKEGSRAKTYQLTNKTILSMIFNENGNQEIVDKVNSTEAGFLSAMLLSILLRKD
jgi:hypothetical protein